jgi:uncharacterized repeat protein (TIGR03803 family)
MRNLNLWKAIILAVTCCVLSAIASPAQTFNTLASFNGTDGAEPQYMSITQGTDGNLYGTTYSGGANNNGTVFKITQAAP